MPVSNPEPEGFKENPYLKKPEEEGRRGFCTVKVERKFRQGDYTPTKEETFYLPVEQFEGPVAEVGCSLGLTLALEKRFEFARLDVSVKFPCYPEEVAPAYDRVANFVKRKLQEEVAGLERGESG